MHDSPCLARQRSEKLLGVFFPFLPTVFTRFDVVLQTLTCKDWDMFVLGGVPEDFECDTGSTRVLLQMAVVTLAENLQTVNSTSGN